jgi:hypothetical protein
LADCAPAEQTASAAARLKRAILRRDFCLITLG